MADLPGPSEVLFICSQNAGRSQMAEGFFNTMYGERYRACSDGMFPSAISPLTVRIMQETEIDLSHQNSKSPETFHAKHFDTIVFLCNEECDTFTGLSDPDTIIIYKHVPDTK